MAAAFFDRGFFLGESSGDRHRRRFAAKDLGELTGVGGNGSVRQRILGETSVDLRGGKRVQGKESSRGIEQL